MFRFLVCLLVAPSLQWSSFEETTLRHQLSTNYSIYVRPQKLTVINLYFQLSSLDQISMKNQYFKVSGWWFMSWNDSRLTWTPSDYGGIEYLYYYESCLWRPAIVISNSNEDLSAIEEETIPARVRYDGQVTWQPPGIDSMGCGMDNTYFPFDKQTCALQVTSFGYTSNEVDIETDFGIKTDFYSENGDWSIISLDFERTVYYDEGSPYVRVTYSLTVKRRSSTHWINIIIPILLNGALIPMMFLLPPDSGEKMGYSLTVLLAYFVLLTMILDDMSTSAKHTSLLEVYITITLGVGAATTVLSILVIKCYSRDNEKHHVPTWLLKATRFGMKLTQHETLQKKKEKRKNTPVAYPQRISSTQNGVENESSPRRPENHEAANTSIEPTIQTDQSCDELNISWQLIADVMDAVFFRIFSTFLLSLTLCFVLFMTLGDA